MIWKDTTGYSLDSERIPTTWTCIVHCDPFFRERQLEEVETKEDAQAKATEMLRGRLSFALTALAPPDRGTAHD